MHNCLWLDNAFIKKHFIHSSSVVDSDIDVIMGVGQRELASLGAAVCTFCAEVFRFIGSIQIEKYVSQVHFRQLDWGYHKNCFKYIVENNEW